MALELRPTWCLHDDAVADNLELSSWMNADGSQAAENDGDDWAPGTRLELHRVLTAAVGHNELRQILGLEPGIGIGLAARWVCRATSAAGTHRGGPEPIPFDREVRLDVEVPAHVADQVELETCVLARWLTDEHGPETPPDNALLWSDAWSVNVGARSVQVEGSETRIPVQTVPFSSRFPESSEALWSVEFASDLQLDDLVANSLTVLLNESVLERDFADIDGKPDASRLPGFVQSAVQVDIISGLLHLTSTEQTEDEANEFPEGTVGALLASTMLASYGSLDSAIGTFQEDPTSFTRELWSTYAPNSWKARG